MPAALAEVPGRTLGGVIDRTAFAMSSEESRYTLNGALLVLQPGKVEMVATDGSRLSLAVREAEVAGLKSEEGTLVPRRALGAIRRLAEAQESDTPIKIARDDSHLFFFFRRLDRHHAPDVWAIPQLQGSPAPVKLDRPDQEI